MIPFLISTGFSITSYFREEGLFQVRETEKITSFETLTGAVLYYENINSDASLWDISEGEILIEKKFFISPSCTDLKFGYK